MASREVPGADLLESGWRRPLVSPANKSVWFSPPYWTWSLLPPKDTPWVCRPVSSHSSDIWEQAWSVSEKKVNGHQIIIPLMVLPRVFFLQPPNFVHAFSSFWVFLCLLPCRCPTFLSRVISNSTSFMKISWTVSAPSKLSSHRILNFLIATMIPYITPFCACLTFLKIKF